MERHRIQTDFVPRKGETSQELLDGLTPESRQSVIEYWLLKRRSDARDQERWAAEQKRTTKTHKEH